MLNFLINTKQQATCDTVVLHFGYKIDNENEYHPCWYSYGIVFIKDVYSNFPSYQYYQQGKADKCPHKWNSNKQKNYYPNVTIKRYAGGIEAFVIKFSVPKLLYGTSINDAPINQYYAIRNILKFKLKKMGIYISDIDIDNAYVSEIHPVLNIWLPKKLDTDDFFQEVSKYHFKFKALSIEKFENAGKQISAYTKKSDIVVYDKNLEISTPRHACIEYTDSDGKKHKEYTANVLRFECRLHEKNYISKHWDLQDGKYESRFALLMNSNIFQPIKSTYWKMLVEDRDIYRCAEPELYSDVKQAIQNNRKVIRHTYIEEMEYLIEALRYESYCEIKSNNFPGFREKLDELKQIGKTLPHIGIDHMLDYMQIQIDRNEAYAEQNLL